MAKKTNYLTELIERHERWRAEGGERVEEEDRRVVEEEYVSSSSVTLPVLNTTFTAVLQIPRIFGTSALLGTQARLDGPNRIPYKCRVLR